MPKWPLGVTLPIQSLGAMQDGKLELFAQVDPVVVVGAEWPT